MSDVAAAYPDLVPVAVRYGDRGPDGLVTTAALARWFEDTRISGISGPYSRLVADGGYGALRILLATLGVERLAPIRAGTGAVRVGIGVRRIGTTSFTYGYGVFAGDECVGRGETVTVLADASGPAALPEPLRDDLGRTLIDERPPEPDERPGPDRYRRSSYPFAVPLRARVGDLDTNAHVNNVTLVTWYAEAVAAFATEVLGTGWGGPPPELAPTAFRVRFVAEVGYPADYEVALAVTAADDGTVDYALGVFRGDDCVGLAEATGARGDLPAAALDRHRSP